MTRFVSGRYWWLSFLPLLLLGSGCWIGCVSRESPDGETEATSSLSHNRMLQLLQQLPLDDDRDNPLYSQRLLDESLAQLRSLPDSTDLAQRINLLSRIGDLQLIMGENRSATRHLEEALKLLRTLRGRVPATVERHALKDVAVSFLRLGEIENCVANCTCESCLLPIRPGGQHQKPEGSRRALEYLRELLQKNPDDLSARWLLNVASMTVGDYPAQVATDYLIPADVWEADGRFPRFRNEAQRMGLDVVSLSGGVIVDDFDDDGWLDVVMSDWGLRGQLRYFRNDRQGQFVEETEAAGLNGLFGGLNLLQADYDNDGDLDILVLRGAWRGPAGRHPNSLLRNDGQGRFQDVTFAAGLGDVHYPTQTAAWSDYDNDGQLDLFIGNENYPCQLFHNVGSGRFEDVAAQAGVTNNEYTKGCSWGDYNSDGYPDLYVNNYGTPLRLEANSQQGTSSQFFVAGRGAPNRLYRNNRNGTFTDVAESLQVTRPLKGFATWFWDVNNDGNLDLFAASYDGSVADVAAEYLGRKQRAEDDCLYVSDGRGGFREVGYEWGLKRVTLSMGANFGDLDNDGFDEIYLGTGAPDYDSLVPNIMYWNRAGKSFRDITGSGGFGHLQKGHGVAFADLNNDGDQDVVHVVGGAYPGDMATNVVFENPGNSNHWICVKLIGAKSNRSAIGAHIKVEIEEEGSTRAIHKWVNSGGSFGANPLRREIGLGSATRIRCLTIDWPTSQTTQTFYDVGVNQFIEVHEGAESFSVKSQPERAAAQDSTK
ncbi:MAG: FG-GAP-like repeat-containing protein [Planctomycetota bacterium]